MLSTKCSSMISNMLQLSRALLLLCLSMMVALMSCSLRSSSHSFFFSSCSTGVLVFLYSLKRSPNLFLFLCLMVMLFSLLLMIFSYIFLLFSISSSWFSSKILSSASLLMNSFFSL